MSLNLNKHGAAMQTAWKSVCDDKNDTDWALFGYEGSTFDLKLIGTGEDGIDELKEDLNASKILYAFVRVVDKKTSLPKFVFLHWQGESVPGTRKGMAATHLRDVERYFHGAHITITVRNDDEVDEDDILAKVSKSTASSFNFREKQTPLDDQPPAPVGTSHRKINPQQELPDLDAREKFWSQEESRERERIAQEKERKVSESKKIERERREREEREAGEREAAIRDRERRISQIKESEASAMATAKKNGVEEWQTQMARDAEDERERQNRGEEMKRRRNEEARQLIGQRSTEARSVFERNSSVGQMNFRRQSSSSSAPAAAQIRTKPVSPEPADSPDPPRIIECSPYGANGNANEVSTDDVVVPPPDSFGNDDNGKRAVDSVDNQADNQPDVTGVATGASQPDLLQDVKGKHEPDLMASSVPKKEEKNGGSEYGISAMALYDYQAADETEISFDPGQIITHIDQIDPGWWQGLGPDGNYGLFPANYVELVDSSQVGR